MIEILYKSKNVVVVNKPQGMPSAPDPSRDIDALSATSEILRSCGEDSRLWLVHRLDRSTGGIIMFARNSRTAATLSEKVREHQLIKEYIAVVEGRAFDSEMVDYIYKDNIRSRAVVAKSEIKGAKLARLHSRVLETVVTEKGERSLVYITLETGRFHQIRAQFSSRGMAVAGDGKYGSSDKRAKAPALYSAHLSFTLGEEKIDCIARPDSSLYPWCLFDLTKI